MVDIEPGFPGVGHFSSRNASIRPEVSFAVAVRASSSVVAAEEKVNPLFGNSVSRGI